MQVNLSKAIDELKSNWIYYAIIIFLILLLRSCGNVVLEIDNNNIELEKRVDSLQKNSKIKLEQVSNLEKENSKSKDSIKNLIKASKTKEILLYKLQKSSRPHYITEVKDCNDTIQSIYDKCVLKDSLCNVIIDTKNNIIAEQDGVIVNDSLQKTILNSVIDEKDIVIKLKNDIIIKDKNQIKIEKRKKTFWQVIAGALTVLKFIK